VVAQKTVEPDPLQPGVTTETMRYLGGDHLGSASIVTDDNGDLDRGVRYEPYGRIRDEWGPEAESEDYAVGGVDDLFNGKPRTRKAFGLTGLMGGDYELEGYDYGARIYLPELSRWASADSITPDTVWEANAFAYVRNNPLKYVDPDGHFAQAIPLVVRYVAANAFRGAAATAIAAPESSSVVGIVLGVVLWTPGRETSTQPAHRGGSPTRGVSASQSDRLLWQQYQQLRQRRLQGGELTAADQATELNWLNRASELGISPDTARAPRGGFAPRLLGRGEMYKAHEHGSDGLLAHLDAHGTLNLYIKRGPETPSGGEMFNEAMAAFGSNVQAVRGTWHGGGDLADNFDAFKAAIANGLDPEEAAFQTFTGRMAARHGFVNATVTRNDDSKVSVEFRR